MKVTVFTTMPPGVYSGGRYLSLMLAYAMSRAGAEVTYITNNAPLFERDFQLYQQQYPIRSLVIPTYALPEDLKSDWVVVIPTSGFNNRYYNSAIEHAKASEARLALLSFETPNWYAELSPYPRSPMPTEGWRQVVAGGGLVVTIAEEGLQPARAYFGEGNERTPRLFDHWHPSINDLVAAAATDTVTARPRRSVTMFVRTEDPHKGARDLLRLPPDVLEGHVLSLVFGRGVDDDYVAALRRHFAPARDFAIEVLSQITDEEKFVLLSRSKLLLFPSYFEGYGYPPVEAAWMGVPSVAYDLPLLREVAGDAVQRVPLGDIDAFAAAIRQSLAERPPGPDIRAMLRVSPDTLTAGQKMLDVLRRATPALPVSSGQVPSLPVPQGGAGPDPHVAQLLSHHAGPVNLYELSCRLEAGRVRVSGRIEGVRKGDRLRIDLPNGAMPLVVLEPVAEGLQRFSCDGQLDRWAAGSDVLSLRLSLMRADRSTQVLGAVDLRPDWVALLAVTAEGGVRQPQDIVVYADPAGIVARPLLAALLSEFCAGLQQTGRRATLLVPQEALPPALSAAGALALDLLPLFDAVIPVSAAAVAPLLAGVRAGGGLVAATPQACPAAGLDPEAGLTLDPGEAEDALVLFAPGAVAGRQPVRPDAQRWGRQGRKLAAAPQIVVIPPAGITALEPAARASLKQLERNWPGLRLFIPAALCAASEPLPVGIGSQLEPIGTPELTALLAQKGGVLGLALPEGPQGAEARAIATLLAVYRVPVLALEEAQAGLQQFAAPGEVMARVAPLLPEGRERPGLSVLAGAMPRLPARTQPRPVPPALLQGSVLGFSASLDEDCPALITGWSDRTMLGARIAKDRGVVAFRLLPAETAPARLELMLHLSPAADPGLSVKVVLNGHLLGVLSRLPVGASVHVLPARDEVWTEGDQVLMLMLIRSEAALPASKITLISVSPAAAVPRLPALNTPVAQDQRQAPLYTTSIEEGSGVQSGRYGRGAPAGFMRLMAGWSVPEAEFTWTASPTAAVGFFPALSSAVPMLLTLQGNALATPGGQPPRLTLRQGDQVLAETVLPAGRTGAVQVPLPAGAALDTLLLDFPDAVCPAVAGIGNDTRLLGLALQAAECRLLPVKAEAATLLPDADEAWPVLLGHLAQAEAGLLRLTGQGPLPQGVRFGLARTAMTVCPVAGPGGGWSVSLPLPPEVIAGGRAEILCLAADAALPCREILCENWADPPHRRPAAAGAQSGLGITLVALHDNGLAAPAALDWSAPVDLRTPSEARLALPAEFTFAEEAPDVPLLAGGWSQPEPDWVWSAGPAAEIRLPAPLGGALLRLDAGVLIYEGGPRQRIRLSTRRGVFATVIAAELSPGPLVVALPPGFGPAEGLGFEFPDSVVPAEVGLSPDTRRLAMRLQHLRIEPLPGRVLRPAAPEGLTAPAILSVGRLAEGGRVVVIAGQGPVPFGLSQPGTGAEVIAHPFPAPGGWQALVTLSAGAVAPKGTLTLRLYATAEAAEGQTPAELSLPMPSEGEA
jgi:glycosyltransferase involved in cell wall biosynthesis